MGGSSFSYSSWTDPVYTSTRSTTTTASFAHVSSLPDSINPSKMKGMVREARDSTANPNSTPVIVGLDFTGSMQDIPAKMISEGLLGELFNNIYTRKPVSDPQVCFCGIGDVVVHDRAPFQVGQFEAGNDELVNSLTSFWLDGCSGGGNGFESYDLAYWFAANHTVSDSMQKRNKKGFIVTIGDESPCKNIRAQDIETVFGYKPEGDVSFVDLMTKVRQSYVPYHIIVEHGGRRNLTTEFNDWKAVMGQNVVVCTDYTKLPEIIVSLMQLENGESKDDIIGSWKGDTAVVVAKAFSNVAVAGKKGTLTKF